MENIYKFSDETIEWIEENSSEFEVELYEDYSGRGMLGATTDAFTFNSISGLFGFFNLAKDEDIEEVVLYFIGTDLRLDSLGMSQIIYRTK